MLLTSVIVVNTNVACRLVLGYACCALFFYAVLHPRLLLLKTVLLLLRDMPLLVIWVVSAVKTCVMFECINCRSASQEEKQTHHFRWQGSAEQGECCCKSACCEEEETDSVPC